MGKLRTYAILTTSSDRIEVKAYNVNDAYRKARNKLLYFKSLKEMRIGVSVDLTESYMTFGKEGINYSGFKTTNSSIKAYNIYKLRRRL